MIAASRDPDPGLRGSARHNMGLMAPLMSHAQIAQAQALAQGWSPR